MNSYTLSASLVCGDPLSLGADIRALVDGGIDAIHFDVMDGHFVPRLGLYPELLESVKEISSLPVDVHLMITHPEQFAVQFAHAGADVVVVHAEATPHVHRVVHMIRDAGARAGVALNPGTPLSVLDYVLGDIDLVLLMAINPGIVGHKLIPSMLEKIAETKEKLVDHPNVVIEVDGGVTPESAATMIQTGADMLVCGTSSVFRGPDLAASARAFREHIDTQLRHS